MPKSQKPLKIFLLQGWGGGGGWLQPSHCAEITGVLIMKVGCMGCITDLKSEYYDGEYLPSLLAVHVTQLL